MTVSVNVFVRVCESACERMCVCVSASACVYECVCKM